MTWQIFKERVFWPLVVAVAVLVFGGRVLVGYVESEREEERIETELTCAMSTDC